MSAGNQTPTLSAHIIVTVMTGNHCANNQKDPYVSTAHIPVELTLYGLARYIDPPVTSRHAIDRLRQPLKLLLRQFIRFSQPFQPDARCPMLDARCRSQMPKSQSQMPELEPEPSQSCVFISTRRFRTPSTRVPTPISL